MANHPRNTECPAVAELVRALQAVIPELRGNRIGTVRSDGSRHTAGLAADIMLDSTNEYEKMIADDIIEALIAMQGQIRWHDILYTDWNPATSAGGGSVPFHFHIPGGGGGYGGQRLKKNVNNNKELGKAHENTFMWIGLTFHCVSRVTPFSFTTGRRTLAAQAFPRP